MCTQLDFQKRLNVIGGYHRRAVGFSKAAINFRAVYQENQLAIYSEGYGCTVLYWTVVATCLRSRVLGVKKSELSLAASQSGPVVLWRRSNRGNCHTVNQVSPRIDLRV